ncbi:hypothetical protein CANCADRAFT_3963 [Tortispora caseinolytica NRRL Y-17796]|uniref:EF-hand domain-containing protein n=1 Tax=Tortispora caseinolytica NRRL Y-17796 TaxID=767744 RepID=A0A1E4TC46_9ASCO|nr:hypothetical protein CANCADRAFT_3963 [Tortispora caseinolytica NRRL Y-17796]
MSGVRVLRPPLKSTARFLALTHPVTPIPRTGPAKILGYSRQFSTACFLRQEFSSKSAAQVAKRRLISGVKYTFLGIGVVSTSLLGVLLAFFLYDATTYHEPNFSDEPVKVMDLAINPRRGGPKNLPIVEYLLSEYDTSANSHSCNLPRLVILGSGWGAVSTVKNLHKQAYHTIVLSPINYFLFTPMLPSATVGTLTLRSLVEPIRKVVARIGGHYLQAEAVGIVPDENLVEVRQTHSNGDVCEFYIKYDKLVVATGTVSNTHGVEGLQHCNTLKTVEDARDIRQRVIENFERASIPSVTEEERQKLLSFVICGGGPTGVEFAAELFDMINEDLVDVFPKILAQQATIHIIQSRSNILNTYDEKIAEYAMERFKNDNIDVITNARVQRVFKDTVVFSQKQPDGSTIYKELPYGLCLWSTGVGQNEFTKHIVSTLPGQGNKRAIETDSHLRVIGAPLGSIYAIGDCSTVKTAIADNIISMLRSRAKEVGKNFDKLELTYHDWYRVAQTIKKRFPQASDHLKRVDEIFEEFDKDHSGTMSTEELEMLLRSVDSKIVSLPATAQRAHQQGVYLAKKLNKLALYADGLQANDVIMDGDIEDTIHKPFRYQHLGSLAYIGNAAVFDLNGHSFFGGLLAMYLWRSVYFAQSVSLRTRMLLAIDWLTRGLFGRDMIDV